MRWAVAGVIFLHGAIHFMGFAKSFGLAELPQLTQPISRPWGVAWLGAGALMAAAAALYLTAPRLWWLVALVAVVLSQVVIFSSWEDARFGTIANLIVVALAVRGLLAHGLTSGS